MNVIRAAQSYFEPRLQISTDAQGMPHAVDTTGDTIDPELTLMIPKGRATLGHDDKGEQSIAIARGDQTQWVPRQAFQESDGPNGVYYLPTYRDSASSAVIGGAIRGVISLGPLGLVSGAVGGFAGTRMGDAPFLKMGVGAAAGAATLAAGHALLFGAQGLPVAAFAGAVSGLGATVAGAGQASSRDAVYGGSLAGFAAGLATGMPVILLTGAAAAAIGSQANSKIGKALTGAAAGAALTAAQAALIHGPIGLAAGIGAAVGAVGPLLGPPIMYLSRNLTDDGAAVVRHSIGHWVQQQNETTLTVLWGLPYAASFGLIGSAASAIQPGWGTAGAVIGAVAGGAMGVYQGHKLIEKLKARQTAAQIPETVRGAVEAIQAGVKSYSAV